MNLRMIHAALILLSALLAVVFAVWSLGQFGRGAGVAYLIAGVGGLAAAAGLIAYDSWFLRKTRVWR